MANGVTDRIGHGVESVALFRHGLLHSIDEWPSEDWRRLGGRHNIRRVRGRHGKGELIGRHVGMGIGLGIGGK